jgi:CheY-like chemotaxis protein
MSPPLWPDRRLVIADDSAEMRWLVRATIGDQFAAVVEADDGRALLWALLRTSLAERRDLFVITDLAMPGYHGLEVLEAWRALERDAPTIVITAFPSQAVRDRAAELGVIVLAKPFSTQALRATIEEARHAAR